MSISTADREIVATRLLDASRDLVFRLWTEQEHIERWWAPDGFSVTTSERNVRPGGVWRFILHSPDGGNYHNKIVYAGIVPPERLTYTHTGGSQFRTTVKFAESGRKTKVTVRMVFDSAVDRAQALETFHAVEGLNLMLERLEKHLTEMLTRGEKE